ncbi:MAG: hypothetical protein LBU82_07540, partial [Treponema sp.]|nr:hypothetical protein [Treponema sp.]
MKKTGKVLVIMVCAFAMLAACASGGVQSNAAVAAAAATDDADIAIRDASDSQTPAGALSVNSESAWNAAINKIRNGGDNKDYVIHVTGAVTVPAIPVDEYLFRNVT